jgi:hypothetical protein
VSRRLIAPANSDATALDLQAHSEALARVLPALLFRRDWIALVRWCKVRSWIDNSLDGETSPDLLTIELAVAYLTERAFGQGRP